jgi:hypothetical protein
MWYLILVFVSLLVCIVSAQKMRSSIGLAVLFGLLASPASGIIYAYMALSGERRPWRVALIGGALCIGSVSLLVVLLTGFKPSGVTPIADTNVPSGVSQESLSYTLYTVECQGTATSMNDCVNPRRANQIVFVISPNTQSVEITFPSEQTSPKLATRCSITDANNWVCPHDTGVGAFGVKDGIYFSTTQQAPGISLIGASPTVWQSLQPVQ